MALFNNKGQDVTKEVPHHFKNEYHRVEVLAPLQEKPVLEHKHAGKFFRLETRAKFKA